MSQELPQKEPKSLMIAGIIIGLIVLLGFMLFALTMVLSLMTTNSSAQSIDLLKTSAMKANTSAAMSATVKYFVDQRMPAKEAINKVITELNTAGTPNDLSDDGFSPYDKSIPVFGIKPGPGVVILEAKDSKTIVITAYDKHVKPMTIKTINFDETSSSLEEAKKRVKESNQFE